MNEGGERNLHLVGGGQTYPGRVELREEVGGGGEGGEPRMQSLQGPGQPQALTAWRETSGSTSIHVIESSAESRLLCTLYSCFIISFVYYRVFSLLLESFKIVCYLVAL